MLNAGDTLGVFEIVGLVGKGGMGEVYLARDTRLSRDVAIKVLPENFAKDAERLSRFEREARLLASLNHPNIATIHDFQNEDGNYFLVMEHIGGDTLGEYIEKNPVSSDTIIDLFTQMAEALDVAHRAGVVHRDLKPDNVKIHNGLLKVLDFGLAKDSIPQPEQTSPDSPTIRMSPSPGLVTESGVILGTPMYMSPEQARGKDLDERTDIWALGCCLFEALTGETPFKGDTAADILGEVLQRDPDYSLIAKSVPKGLTDLVRSCLEKKPDDRPRSMGAVADSLRQLTAASGNFSTMPMMAKVGTAVGFMGCVAAVVALFLSQRYSPSDPISSSSSQRDLQTEILLALDADDPVKAYDLARELEAQEPDNEILATLWDRISNSYVIESNPPGAKVLYTTYDDESNDWQEIGTTPLEKRLPFETFRLKFDLDGYGLQEIARSSVYVRHNLINYDIDVKLIAKDASYSDMVYDSSEQFAVPITEFAPLDRVTIPEYLIDRFEVTNGQYKEFVDAGGYSDSKWWTHPLMENGRTLSFEDAVSRFTGKVGRPGPAGWELGDYPAGQDDYPVGGVSWFEAAAYAEFRGKSLPTIYHWSAALFMDNEGFHPMAPDIRNHSNLNTGAIAPVGQYHGIGTSGAIDMGGNQREWCFNDSGRGRYTMGGSWEDQPYLIVQGIPRSPWNRSLANGFRCAVYLEESPPQETLLAAILRPQINFRAIKPIADAAYEVLASQGQIGDKPMEAASESTDTSNRNWNMEVITIAGVENERLQLDLITPKSYDNSLAPVVFFPGMDCVLPGEIAYELYMDLLDFVPKSGRALIIPHYRGMWENSDGTTQDRLMSPSKSPALVQEWAQDFSRAIQFIDSRDDLRNDSIAYLGVSLGTVIGTYIIPFVDERLSCSVLIAGGFSSPTQPQYAPRVTNPTIMINGNADYMFPVDQKQLPMFDMLGTAPEHKKHVVLEGGHVPDEALIAREALAWLDKYQPVNAESVNAN